MQLAQRLLQRRRACEREREREDHLQRIVIKRKLAVEVVDVRNLLERRLGDRDVQRGVHADDDRQLR